MTEFVSEDLDRWDKWSNRISSPNFGFNLLFPKGWRSYSRDQ